MRRLLMEAERVLVGGHRGCVCEQPENSIGAMEKGIKGGADYLEIDVQLTLDRVPVIYHDVRLEKRTDLTGYVHEFPLDRLKERIPGLCTLKEALEWGRGEETYFALELKTVPMDMQMFNLRLTEIMIPLIIEQGMEERVFLFGQDYRVLRKAKEHNRKIETGLIVPFVPADPVKLMESMEAMVYLSYIYNMTPPMIRQLRERGYFVSGAILREERWMSRAIEAGVHMFEADEPAAARKLIEEKSVKHIKPSHIN